ncbi:40S ribosomal protein S15-like [Sturnira hondurensis]|uniref:40S ribosomal protein S15-like n=1 Tax=Sturnira hondurensis TaxID=192404 RepID=UPI00187A6B46|nr:40S ribosomal protein S15-like [Sturnira hondurensis]
MGLTGCRSSSSGSSRSGWTAPPAAVEQAGEVAPKRLREVKQEAPPKEASYVAKTYLQEVIALPGLVGSLVGVYNLKIFNQGKIKPEMFGHYFGEFTSSKPVKLGQPYIGTTHSSYVIPLKQSIKTQTSLKT